MEKSGYVWFEGYFCGCTRLANGESELPGKCDSHDSRRIDRPSLEINTHNVPLGLEPKLAA